MKAVLRQISRTENRRSIMRLALAFFGITRSLKYTMPSIQKHFFDVFDRKSIDFDVYMHTYELAGFCNTRTGEVCTNYDNEEYKLLKPDFLKIDNQDAIKTEINLEQYRTCPDPWKTKYNSVDNFVLAQYSKAQVTELIDKNEIQYDYIIFVRPDVYFLDDIQLRFLEKVDDRKICIPDFHAIGPFRFNDRFSITNAKTYKVYGQAFDLLFAISKKIPLHSETILGAIIHNNGIEIVHIPFLFLRIRFDGSIEKRDRILINLK